MSRRFFLDLTLEALSAEIQPAYRAKQLYQWVYQQYGTDFNEISTLPKTLRAELTEKFSLDDVTIAHKATSSDGSEKYLFRLKDGHTVEAVLLLMREAQTDDEGHPLKQAQYTVCLSTQVGCKVGCAFCMTAKGGFVRNLSPGEIVAQVLLIKRDHKMAAEKALNLVYMGMGEPLDNLENVAKAIKIFSTEAGLSLSPKRQTLSTSGISPKIDKLGEMDLGVHLAISLHAVDNVTREKLIPMNKAFPIESVIAAVKRFPYDTRKRVMFEYLMIKGVNDSIEAAKTLVKLLSGIKAKVNLIYFNPHEGSDFERPARSSMEGFQRYLMDRGIVCTIRESRGIDIDAACGQLRERYKENVPCETTHTATGIIEAKEQAREFE